MQWNRVNISKDELKKKQEEYIREALEISKKAKHTEEIITPVIIPIPNPDTEIIKADESVADTPEAEPELTTEENTSTVEEDEAYDEIVTTATEEITDDSTEEVSPEELFENVFISEEEAEERLKEAEISAKEISQAAPDFEGYIKKQAELAAKLDRLENKIIPDKIDYHAMKNLRVEAREKLSEIRPRSIGQASRISGVSPADISVLLVWLETL